ncbi:MAG TPA: hypothetical protein VIY72_12145 [Acidimicrobiales bacterium]
MTDTSMGASEVARSTRATAKMAWAGIIFAVLYVAGMLLAGSSPSDIDELNDDPVGLAASWHDYYTDSGNRTVILGGVFALMLASVAVVVFGSVLRERLADAGAATAGRLTFAASIMFGTVTLVGAVALAWIPGTKEFADMAIPTSDLVYMASQLGFGVLLLPGGAAAGFMLVTSGFAAARRGVLPVWLGWAGVVCGVIVFVLGGLFVTMALLVLWTLIAAIVLLRRPTAV